MTSTLNGSHPAAASGGTTKRRLARVALAAAMAGSALTVTAAPAAAAPSCAGLVFSAVAKSSPRAVSTRIAEIKAVEIPTHDPGATFGSVISRRLAQADCGG